MNDSDLKCLKHNQPVVFICSMQSCKEHRLICETCKQKQTLHFSHHANYIYRFKELKQFNNGKTTIPRLEKGLQDCQSTITEHKKFYLQEINSIKEDFASIKQQFNKIADMYQNIYIDGFKKEMEKFDEDSAKIKQILKEYVQEKNEENSFFTSFFDRKKDDGDNIETLIAKNTKAFHVRAQIINLRTTLTSAKNHKVRYKTGDYEIKKFEDLRQYLTQFSNNFFDRFRQLLKTNSESQNLRSSIVSETKSLAMSQVSVGAPFEETRISSSNFSFEKNFRRVQMPQLNLIVKDIRQKLKPIQLPPNYDSNANFQGPFLYSSGVYEGQYDNWKRNGVGTFIFNDGCIYEGTWENDAMSGFGRLIKTNCYYEGQIKEGKANGSGNYEDQHRIYSGEWKNDKRSGVGEEEFKTKRKKYIGSFLNDKYEGKGKLIDEQFTFQGRFKNGLFEGKGKMLYHNRQVFQGEFKQGQKILGKHTYPDGSYYDGNFKNGFPEGTGQFFWADGLKYVGQWKNGYQEGMGSQVHLDGKELKGIWKGGQWQKWL